jgi:hypothetical protein
LGKNGVVVRREKKWQQRGCVLSVDGFVCTEPEVVGGIAGREFAEGSPINEQGKYQRNNEIDPSQTTILSPWG